MRLAMFSPLPPQRSGIADYTQELAAALAPRADVDLWIDDAHPTPERVGELPVVRYARRDPRLAELASYDGVIYHLGNDALYHTAIYEAFCQQPGIVVLHDSVLHHFIHYYFVTLLNRPAAYREEMAYAHGADGAEFANSVLAGNLSLLSHVDAGNYPLNLRVLETATGMIVHSRFARDLARSAQPELPLRHIFHYGPDLPDADQRVVRRRLGLPDERLVIASFGHFVAAKRIDIALHALARLGRSDVLYLLVGQPDPRLDLPALARELGVQEQVRFIDWVDLQDMNDYLQACDVIVNLRHPNMGETSGVVCRSLAAGKACIVSEGGWFSELPADCVIRVPVGDGEVGAVTEALANLLSDARARQRLGAAARYYSQSHHGLDGVADAYLEFVSELAESGELLATNHITAVGSELANLGVLETDRSLIEPVAAVLDEVVGVQDE